MNLITPRNVLDVKHVVKMYIVKKLVMFTPFPSHNVIEDTFYTCFLSKKVSTIQVR